MEPRRPSGERKLLWCLRMVDSAAFCSSVEPQLQEVPGGALHPFGALEVLGKAAEQVFGALPVPQRGRGATPRGAKTGQQGAGRPEWSTDSAPPTALVRARSLPHSLLPVPSSPVGQGTPATMAPPRLVVPCSLFPV